MGYFTERSWLDRVVQFFGRRRITIESQSATEIVGTLTREEGTVTTEGTPLSAANLNDLESRIKTAFDSVETDMASKANTADLANVATSGNYNDLSGKPNLSAKEDTANKVTNITSSSTNTQYPSAAAVFASLNKLIPGGRNVDWKQTETETAQWYFYEGASTTGLDLPAGNVIIVCFRYSQSRGYAFAFDWPTGSAHVWHNNLHDSWKGWQTLH